MISKKTSSTQMGNSVKKKVKSNSAPSPQQKLIDLEIAKIERQIAQNKEKQLLACDYIANRVGSELVLDVSNPFLLNIEQWFEYQKSKQSFLLNELEFVKENHPQRYQETLEELLKMYCNVFSKIDDELQLTKNNLKKSKDIGENSFHKLFSERTKFEYGWLKEIVGNLKNETSLYIEGVKEIKGTTFGGDVTTTKKQLSEKTAKVLSLTDAKGLKEPDLKDKFLKDLMVREANWGECFGNLMEPVSRVIKEEHLVNLLATRSVPGFFIEQVLSKLSEPSLIQLKSSAIRSVNEKMIGYLNIKPQELFDGKYFEEVVKKIKHENLKSKTNVDLIKKSFSQSIVTSCKSQIKFWEDCVKKHWSDKSEFDCKSFVAISLMNNLISHPETTDVLDILKTIVDSKVFERQEASAHLSPGLACCLITNLSAPQIKKRLPGSQMARSVCVEFLEKYEYSNLVLGYISDSSNSNGYASMSEIQALSDVLVAISRNKSDYVIKSIFDQNVVDGKGKVYSQVNVFESLISAAVKSRLAPTDPKLYNFLKSTEIIMKRFSEGNPNATKIIETSFENCFSGARKHATRASWRSWLEAHLLSLKLNDEIGLPVNSGKKTRQRL